MDGNNHNHNSNSKRMASENRRKIGFVAHVGFADLDSAEFKSGPKLFSKPSGGGGVTLDPQGHPVLFDRPSSSTDTVPQDDYDDNNDDDESVESGPMLFSKPSGGGGVTLSTGTESGSMPMTISKPSGGGGVTLDPQGHPVLFDRPSSSTDTVPQDDYDDNNDDDESVETVPARSMLIINCTTNFN